MTDTPETYTPPTSADDHKPLPYEASGTRPGLLPGDLVLHGGLIATVVAARVVINGTIFNWNDKLPASLLNAHLPSYQLEFLQPMPGPKAWFHAHMLALLERGPLWGAYEHRKAYP